ncbi:helical backbone metal receptor [Pasteurellaceae bacterium LFhippo2]|nr:helical backbone metal receptor [Pasteurellaceae bacterium LFhippo2]
MSPAFANQTNTEQFVSLNLCSDRLLIELARPEQISAMSPYSTNPLMMLDKVNHNKPTIEPQLEKLLPYADKTLLINETFYPQLVNQLKQLGFKIIPINDSPQTAEQLFELIEQLGEVTGNSPQAKRLISTLDLQKYQLNRPVAETLILADTGVVDMFYPQYQILLKLLGLKPLKSDLTQQNFSLEKVLLSQPNVLISLTDKQGYSQQGELLSHPLLQNLFKNQPVATMPLKYTYCFDHGLWQGAKKIYHQLK